VEEDEEASPDMSRRMSKRPSQFTKLKKEVQPSPYDSKLLMKTG